MYEVLRRNLIFQKASLDFNNLPRKENLSSGLLKTFLPGKSFKSGGALKKSTLIVGICMLKYQWIYKK
jgi:hypothetical protein